MLTPMRVRFPPSPTGALHIGNARTALYNWLLARGHGGQLVLRIEDTDRERSTPENVQTIFEALEWLGIDWDEGPTYQSENGERHREVVEQLLAGGHAYRSTAGPYECGSQGCSGARQPHPACSRDPQAGSRQC